MLDQTFSSEFEVESIVDQKIIDGQTYYLVKWVGYGHQENTWQPLRHMTHSQQKIANWNHYKFKLLKNLEGNKNIQSKGVRPDNQKPPECTQKIIDAKKSSFSSYSNRQSVFGQKPKDCEIELEIQQKEIKQTIFDKPQVKKLIKQKKASTKKKQLQLFEQRLKSRPKVWQKYLENQEETIKIANQKIKEVIDRVYGTNKQKIEQQKQKIQQNKESKVENINQRSDLRNFGSLKMQSQIELDNQNKKVIEYKNGHSNKEINNKQIVLQILSDSDNEQNQVEIQKLKPHSSKISKLANGDTKKIFQQKDDSESDMDESTNFVSKKQETLQSKVQQINKFKNLAFKSKNQKILDPGRQKKLLQVLSNSQKKNRPKILPETIKLDVEHNQQKIKQTYINKLPSSLSKNVLIVPDTIRLSDAFIKKHSSKQGKRKKQDKQQKQQESSLSTNSEYKYCSVKKKKKSSQTSSNYSEDSHHIFQNDQNAIEQNKPVRNQQKQQKYQRDQHNDSSNKQKNKQMQCIQIEIQNALQNVGMEKNVNSNMVALQKFQINASKLLNTQIETKDGLIIVQATNSLEKPQLYTKQELKHFKCQSSVQKNIDKPQNCEMSIQNVQIQNNNNNKNNGFLKIVQTAIKVPNQCISEQINYVSMDHIQNKQNQKLEKSYQSIPKSLPQNKQNSNEILRQPKLNIMNRQSQKMEHVTGPFDCSISTIEYIQVQSQIIDIKQNLEIQNLEFDFSNQIPLSVNRNSEIDISNQYFSNNNYHIINYSSLTNHISTRLPEQSGQSYTIHQNQYILQQNFLRNRSLTTRASFNTHKTQIQSHQLNHQELNIMGSLLVRSEQTVQKSKNINEKKDQSFYYSAQSQPILNSVRLSIQEKNQHKTRSLNLENILQQINNRSLNLYKKRSQCIQANENITENFVRKKIQIDLISNKSKQNEIDQNDQNQKIIVKQNTNGEKLQLNFNQIQTNTQLSQPAQKSKKRAYRKRVQNKQFQGAQVHSEERIDNKQSKERKSSQKEGMSPYHRRFILYNDFSYCN